MQTYWGLRQKSKTVYLGADFYSKVILPVKKKWSHQMFQSTKMSNSSSLRKELTRSHQKGDKVVESPLPG